MYKVTKKSNPGIAGVSPPKTRPKILHWNQTGKKRQNNCHGHKSRQRLIFDPSNYKYKGNEYTGTHD